MNSTDVKRRFALSCATFGCLKRNVVRQAKVLELLVWNEHRVKTLFCFVPVLGSLIQSIESNANSLEQDLLCRKIVRL